MSDYGPKYQRFVADQVAALERRKAAERAKAAAPKKAPDLPSVRKEQHMNPYQRLQQKRFVTRKRASGTYS